MKVTLYSTTKIVELETPTGVVPARLWEGHTESGIAVHAFITRVAVQAGADTSQFERELQACAAPSARLDAVYPSRLVL